ncbi:WD40-repeat-containing domain protein [Catenaria anguillulae PL171]|uniref:WD40-repeat-containing domain protein n=1 Tax=Catenaria anguillulae PL171 TaxID=765915 RepID=A0A1Y2HXU5_9FUNG|nr:WD40-repeat-containing domain protein [Catenaria anguillulae PL171]
MSRPISLLVTSPTAVHLVAVSGPTFAVYDAQARTVLASADVFAAHAHKLPIRSACFSPNGQYLVTTGEDKLVKVWSTSNWGELVNERVVDKRLVEVCVTADCETLVCADKHGDVWTFPFLPSTPPSTVPSADGTIIVGHVSMVTAAKLLANDTCIASADRDEKIRISQFPKGYNIEAFLLGHKQFVAHVLPVGESHLVSAGGDDFVPLWNWKEGKMVAKADLVEKSAGDAEEESSIAVRSVAVFGESKAALVVEGTKEVVLLDIDTSADSISVAQRVSVPEDIGSALSVAYDTEGNLWVGGMTGLACLVADAVEVVDLASYGEQVPSLRKNLDVYADEGGDHDDAPKKKRSKKDYVDSV